jgi:hypothetical protein
MAHYLARFFLFLCMSFCLFFLWEPRLSAAPPPGTGPGLDSSFKDALLSALDNPATSATTAVKWLAKDSGVEPTDEEIRVAAHVFVAPEEDDIVREFIGLHGKADPTTTYGLIAHKVRSRLFGVPIDTYPQSWSSEVWVRNYRLMTIAYYGDILPDAQKGFVRDVLSTSSLDTAYAIGHWRANRESGWPPELLVFPEMVLRMGGLEWLDQSDMEYLRRSNRTVSQLMLYPDRLPGELPLVLQQWDDAISSSNNKNLTSWPTDLMRKWVDSSEVQERLIRYMARIGDIEQGVVKSVYESGQFIQSNYERRIFMERLAFQCGLVRERVEHVEKFIQGQSRRQ